MQRVPQHLLRRAGLDDPAGYHTIGGRDSSPRVMGDEHQRQPHLVLQAAQEVEELRRVDTSRPDRFVGHDHLRFRGKGAGDRDASHGRRQLAG
jgi:hypothetical protein